MFRRIFPLHLLLVIGASVGAFALRYHGFKYLSGDMRNFLLPWYDYIIANGGYKALGHHFSNYTPPYTYFLVAATYLRGILSPATSIKLVSVMFDYYAAIMMYKLVKLKYPQGPVALSAYIAVLLAHTIIVNSSYWGQCDIIYGSMLLTCLYFVCSQRYLLSMLAFSGALAFKLQALFLFPFLLIFFFKRRIPWSYGAIPLVIYVITVLPCVFLGRDLVDLLTIYLQQGQAYHSLSKNAPNLYIFIPNTYYGIGLRVGLIGAMITVLSLSVMALKTRVRLSNEILVANATLSVAIMPFILPKMHDRFFFPADLLSIALAFYQPDLWFIPIMFQSISAMAYSVFLTGTPMSHYLLKLASVLNTSIIILLIMRNLSMFFPKHTRDLTTTS